MLKNKKSKWNQLEKGEYTNLQISNIIDHGLKKRIQEVPVDKHGNVVDPLSRNLVGMKKMMLNRRQS